ncbi:MAG: single-stranded-DNA-specific exonuclease RecJ [Rhodospirillaceae bacterium]|nr:single-stranded-DNA-specific exonuclease RecJ [Rhodospirillaceae bacterium]
MDALDRLQPVSGRPWRMRPVDLRVARAIQERYGLPELLARVVVGRGVSLDEVEHHLAPSLRHGLPNPSILKDMDKAAERIARAIRSREPTAVFADYDVDGAAAAAVLIRQFRALGHGAQLYVPDRRGEGYGLNAAALTALAAQGVRLVIAVDCGTTAFEALAAGAAAGLEVIVLDHHSPEAGLPPAYALVNPNRLDESAETTRQLGAVAACGLAFLAAVAVNRAMRNAGGFAGRAEPDLRELLDIVALGTVCDVVPLSGVNRVFVARGLQAMARRRNCGLAALADRAGIAQPVDAEHLGFLLGPRINAGGRIGRADLGARLLATDDPLEAAEIAGILDGHNADRRAIEAAVLDAALMAAERDGPPGALVMAAGEGWHEGVVGIVAARLKERYQRPAIVAAVTEGIAKGSGRSMPGIDLGAAVADARRAGLVIAGGGHPMAAGFTASADRLEELRAFLADRMGATRATAAAQTIDLDGTMAVSAALDGTMATSLARLGPFGSGYPEPRFLVPAARVVQAATVGSDHIRFRLTDAGGHWLGAIAFRAAGTPLGDALLAGGSAALHLVGALRIDRWQGRERVSFRVEDAARPW